MNLSDIRLPRYSILISKLPGEIGKGLFNCCNNKIGNRQRGRIRTNSVIGSTSTKESILAAIKKLYSKKFQAILQDTKKPYGEGGAAKN